MIRLDYSFGYTQISVEITDRALYASVRPMTVSEEIPQFKELYDVGKKT
jgi:hypothetical protein